MTNVGILTTICALLLGALCCAAQTNGQSIDTKTYSVQSWKRMPVAMSEHVIFNHQETWIQLYGFLRASFKTIVGEEGVMATFIQSFEGNSMVECFDHVNDGFKYSISYLKNNAACRMEVTVYEYKTVVHFGNDAEDIIYHDVAQNPKLVFWQNGKVDYGGQSRDWCLNKIENGMFQLDIVAHHQSPCGALLKLDPGMEIEALWIDKPEAPPPSFPEAPLDPLLQLPQVIRLEKAPRYGECFWAQGEIKSKDREFSLNFMKGGTGSVNEHVEKVLLQVRYFFEDDQMSVSTLNKWGTSWESGTRIAAPFDPNFNILVCFDRLKYLVFIDQNVVEWPYSASDYETLDSIHYIQMIGDAMLSRFRFAGSLTPQPFVKRFSPQFITGEKLTIAGTRDGDFDVQFYREDHAAALILEFTGDKIVHKTKDSPDGEAHEVSSDTSSPLGDTKAYQLTFQLLPDSMVVFAGLKFMGNFTHAMDIHDQNHHIAWMFVSSKSHVKLVELQNQFPMIDDSL